MLPGLTKIHWPEYQLGGILAIVVDDRSGRQVLDCASPLALLIGWREEVLLSARENGSAGRADEKRQRAAALKNGAAPAHWFLNSNARQASRLHAPAGRLLYLTGGTPVLPCGLVEFAASDLVAERRNAGKPWVSTTVAAPIRAWRRVATVERRGLPEPLERRSATVSV